MDKLRGLGALMGAGILTFAAVGAVAAVPPSYSISVTKTADPATVPAGGGDVTFTVLVDNTGTGFFQVVNVTDSMGGCSLAFASGDTDADGSLDANETWRYTCTVTDVAPDTTNTASVNACHDGSVSGCNNETHNAQGQGSVTVLLCESDCEVTVTNPPTEPPSEAPSRGGGDQTVPSAPSTDAFGGAGRSGPADTAWLLIVALGALLGSLAVLRPARKADRS